MLPLQTSGAASQIVDAGKTVLAIGREIHDMSKVSLAAYARKTILTSRAYIGRDVAYEPVTKDVLNAIHKMYVSFILNALQMNRLVTKDKTVQELLNVVATEGFEDHQDIAAAFESLDPAGAEEEDAEDKKRIQKEADEKDRVKKLAHDRTEGNTNLSDIKLEDGVLPVGKLIEVTLTNPENKEANVKLNLLVQILPYVVSESIAYKLLTLDALPSIFQRFFQWKTGEISFWRDFVFQLDLVKERQRAMKEDPNNILTEYFVWNKMDQRQKLLDNVSQEKHLRARNVANTILVLSEQTLKMAKVERGFDLHNMEDRERFFANSLAMVIAVIDPLYNHVTLYFNGLKDGGTYTFDQFKSANKKGDSALDIISAMSAFSRGTAPKF